MNDQTHSATIRHKLRTGTWLRLLLILMAVLPLAVMFLLPRGSLLAGVVWLWFIMAVSFLFLASYLRRSRVADRVSEAEPHLLYEADQPGPVRDVMDVRMA